MKHILIILAIIGSVITSSAQSPRIKLNQITKDTTFGSILMSSMADSGLVYSRDFYINYGVDTFLVLYGDTITGSTILSYVLSDSVTILGDGLLGNELRADTTVLATLRALSDSLALVISSVTADGVTITGDGTVGSPLVVDTSTVISTIQGFLDTLVARGYVSAEQVQDTVANMIIAGLGIETTYNDADGEFLIESLSIEDSIKNETGTLISKGTPLYATGVQGNYWTVAPADASDESKLPVVVIAGEDIADGGTGLGLIKGHIKNVNTSGFTAGDEIWLASGGGYTNVEPKGGIVYSQSLGTVIKVDASSGSGIINIQEPQLTLAPDNIFIGGADSTITSFNARDTFVTISDVQTINGAKTFSTDVEIDGKLDLDYGQSVFIGTDAGRIDNGSNNNNIGIGYQSLYSNTSGNNNTGIGYRALYNNSSGSKNFGIGVESLRYNQTGSNNVGIGYLALYLNSSGINNAAIGNEALFANNSGYQNTGIGYRALQNNTGGYQNTGIGSEALNKNRTGYQNTGIGYRALYYNDTGANNAAIGYDAGRFTSTLTNNTDSDNSIFIGWNTKPLADSQINQIVIGYNAIGLGSNTAVLGNFAITKTRLQGDVGIGTDSPSYDLEVVGKIYASDSIISNVYAGTSDIRLKQDIEPTDKGLDAVMELNPVSYRFIANADSEKKSYGFIAQEIEKVIPDVVGTRHDGMKVLNYNDLISVLTKAIQEQQIIIEELNQRLIKLENK